MERRKILIATKTYPSISQKYRETVCTAGVLLDDNEKPLQWIRIYPIRYRDLEFEKRYKRWSIISAMIERNSKDPRLESYRINDTSIELVKEINTDNNWQERKNLILPLKFDTIQEIKEQGLSLGLIKPKTIIENYIKKTTREWSSRKQAILDQLDLFDFSMELDKIPYKFGYHFIENDDTKHKFSISDWEICQLYRNCRDHSQATTSEAKEKEAIDKVRQQLENFSTTKDLYFIVGNLQTRPQIFMIIGLFYPKLPKNPDFNQLSFL